MEQDCCNLALLLNLSLLVILNMMSFQMTLGILQDKETQIRLRVLHSFIFSKDRTRKVRGEGTCLHSLQCILL